MGMSNTSSSPNMQGQRDGSTRVRHREFITNVGAEFGFDTKLYTTGINPGDGKTFPWLSQLAKGYERYHVNSMRFEYEPFSATTTSGTVSLLVDYDPTDPGPRSKSELLNSYRAVRSSIWMSSHTILSKAELDRDDHLFVRTTSRDLMSENLKLYDVGTLFCAFTDIADVSTLHGELWVSYDITLMIPSFHLSSINNAEVNALIVTDSRYLGRIDPDSTANEKGSSLSYSTHQIDDNAYIEFNEPFSGMVQVSTRTVSGDLFQIEPTLSPAAPISRLAKIGNAVSYFVSNIDTWLHTVEVVADAGERLAWRIVDQTAAWAGSLDLLFTEYAPALMGTLLALRTDEAELTARLQSDHLIGRLPAPSSWTDWRTQHGIPNSTTTETH
ncbi:hypothetical protein 3 [Wenzhou tombus-like virus 9]|uniref:hypothetical protein 3 n=1 Tax=Wenzhou tombus-like virus 9 TaxID=1923679 RepID=UPI00090B3EC3|nr:hypothetical protein 3 [Wenzhou tombus-like virus 9]APG76647.1 hypothetical protein 3 [Wenzhou tombus-like virus 9]